MAPFRWSDSEVRLALGLAAAHGDLEYSGIGTDTRTLAPGELFVALVGEHFDAHDFVGEAFQRGAAGAVVARDVAVEPGRVLYGVRDTLEALGALAHHRRRALPVPVVGVTGTVGKTTTKDLIHAALAARYRVHATEGNLNNLVGLPRTILAAPDQAQVLVLEMGTSRPGEIAALTRIAAPTIGVVTGVAEGHLEGLGDLEGVIREKLDLIAGLDPDALAVVADEPPNLALRARSMHRNVRVAGPGDGADPEFRGEILGADAQGRFCFRWRGQEMALRLRGRHAVSNALLALAVADALAVPAADAAAGVASVEPSKMRGELLRVGDLRLVVDCYNANPTSVRAAVDLLLTLPAPGRRVLVLGTMLELGTRSAALHELVLRELARRPIDLIVATGEFAGAAARVHELEAGRVVAESELEAAYAELRSRLRGNELVLLKASRGVRLERLVPEFRRDFAPNDLESPARVER
ncbi:MAG: UDP-N-acetylmuramoyl-tripeptide--D-alanyl-D-alanine ligase [Gemmatimonadetes bacterium]|nr:UDP-N-acetylmuramoyl-tripeptide--D-alanyl-D-alanine ligase [Gemmatimonadota bacterium]